MECKLYLNKAVTKKVIMFSFILLDVILRDSYPCLLNSVLASSSLIFLLAFSFVQMVVVLQELIMKMVAIVAP